MPDQNERKRTSTWGIYEETKRAAADKEARRLQVAREKSQRLKELRMAMPVVPVATVSDGSSPLLA